MRQAASRVGIAFPIFSVLLFCAADARAVCPTSIINGMGSTLPAWEYAYASPGDTTIGRYDLGSGGLYVHRTSIGSFQGSYVAAADEYYVNLPAGEEAYITASLAVRGWSTASITGPTYSWAIGGTTDSFDSLGTFQRSLTRTIHVMGGQSFQLTWRLDVALPATAGSVWMEGQLGFSDVPPGLLLTSCQGLVPASGATWGSIKARYR